MQTATRKHPAGLPFLFLTEMWERFGYYLMIGIFFLYMTDSVDGGMALEKKEASDIFGTFIALVYLTPFIGGLLADKLLGYRVSITIGGVLMGLGYMGLAIPGKTAFITSLVLMILGNGFFKPNITTLLGALYNDPQYKERKDIGFNIFYMGINVGALICNFFAAYLRNTFGWGEAFIGAGVGMFIGVAVFWLGNKHYKHVDVRQASKPGDMSISGVFTMVLLPAAIAGILGWMIPGNIFGSDSTDAFLFGALPVVVFYASLLFRIDKQDRRPVKALLAIYGVVIIFWAVFKQNGTALTTWAESYTDRELPAKVLPAARSLGMVQDITYVKDSFPIVDHQFRTIKGDNGKLKKEYGYNPYFLNIYDPSKKQEGKQTHLLSTEIFQSINPFFVVMLTPLVIAVFGFLRRRGREPSTPGKIFIGLLITALASLVMVAAVSACNNGAIKSSGWWLIGTYGVITFGELCLSPMGLSLVSKLSPPRITALMMGGWALATSIGNKLSGVLASMWDRYDDKSDFFMVNFFLTLLAAASILIMLRWLTRIVKEHTA
ncbi:MAG: peptide MFS transporter [Bacteroidota bacterium]